MDYYKIKLIPGEDWVATTKRWQVVKLKRDGNPLKDEDWVEVPGDLELTYQEAQQRLQAYAQAQLNLQGRTSQTDYSHDTGIA